MKRYLILVVLLALLLGVVTGGSVAQAAPALQLPWPTGISHHINSGANTYNCGGHTGDIAYAIDFDFDIGDHVSAVAAGTVSAREQTGDGRGNFVEIDHGNGYKTRYLHLQVQAGGLVPWPGNIYVGAWVAQGQHIGYSGNTGSVPAHLHFDMKLNGNAHLPEPMSGVAGFGQYGGCRGVTSPSWTSQPPIGEDDIAVWRPSNGTWYVRGIGNTQYGAPGDVPVPADYNGDGITDYAVWRPSDETWHIRGIGNFQYGLDSDVKVPADYDGDGDDDIAVWRPSTGTWHILGIGNIQYGAPGDLPVPADYNGDGIADQAVWRPSDETWHIRGIGNFQYGLDTDVLVPGDYDGQ